MPTHHLNVIHKKPKGGKSGRPPVLLVHGAWHGAWCWEGNFLDRFAEAGFEVHAIDLRGHGESETVKAMRWNRIADYVDDVASVVETFDRPPVVIGHSMGGYICQHLMHRPVEIAGAGLLATVPYYGVIKTTAKIAVTRPIDFAKANLFWTLYPLVARPAAAKHMFLDSDADAKAIADFHARLIDESYWGFLDMLVFDLPAKPTRNIPVLVVGGQLDTLFSSDSQVATAARYGAICHLIENAPHDLMLSKQWESAADHFVEWAASLG